MKLIFIYGPPAVGKLTVATELSKLTGMPLFHNHLSRNIVKDIYGDKVGEHYDLVDKIRMEVFSDCARSNQDLIFTFVYESPEDDDLVKQYIQIIEAEGGSVHFVQLRGESEDLLLRVDDESRKQLQKLTEKEVLEKILPSLQAPVPNVENLVIDTSKNTPEQSANIIIERLKLPTLS